MPEQSPIAHQIVRDLLQIGVFLQKTGNRITRDFGLTQQQFTVLYEVAGNDRMNQKQLVGELLLEKSNVSKIVNFLQSESLIQVNVCADDARSTRLSITADGRKTINDCMSALHAWNEMWLNPLNQNDLQTTGKVVGKLKKLIQAL
jgi:DNA-binding MarR family transcriptional regulator